MATKYNYSDLGELGKYLQDRETERNTYNAKKQTIAQNKAKQSGETTHTAKIDASGLGSDLAEYLDNSTSTISAKDYKAQLKAQREAIQQKWEQNRANELKRINEQRVANNKAIFESKSNVKNKLDPTSISFAESVKNKISTSPKIPSNFQKSEQQEEKIRNAKQADITNKKNTEYVVNELTNPVTDWLDYINSRNTAAMNKSLNDISAGAEALAQGLGGNVVVDTVKALGGDNEAKERLKAESAQADAQGIKNDIDILFGGGYGDNVKTGTTTSKFTKAFSEYMNNAAEKNKNGSGYDAEAVSKAIEYAHPKQAVKGEWSPTKIVANVTDNFNAMLPQIVFGNTIGGGAGSLASGITLGAQSISDAYKDAKKDGATDEQATNYAIAEFVNQGLGDTVIGGVGGATSGWLDKPISTLASHLVKTPLAKTVLETGADVLGEGAEEVIQNFVSTANKRITYDDDAEFDVSDAVYEGVLGGLGAILYAPGKAFSRYSINKASYNTVNDLSKAAASITSSEDLQTVTQIADKIIESADTVIADKETETADKANAEYIKRGAETVKEQLGNTSEQIIKRNNNANKWVDEYLGGNKETTAKNLTDFVRGINSTSFGNNSSNKINNAVDYINGAIQQQKEVISQANSYVGTTDTVLNRYTGSQTITDLARQNARQMISEATEKISKLKKLSETIRSQKQDIEKGLKYGSAVFDNTEVANEPPINRTTSQVNTNQQTNTSNTQTAETPNNTDVKAETPLTETEDNATINTEEVASKTEATTPTVEAPVVEATVETQAEEKKPSLTHFTTKHTKTGENLEVFTINGHLDTDEYNALKAKIKEVGGTYSKFLKGFIVSSDKVDNAVSKVSEFADVTEKNVTSSSANATSGENTATAPTDNATTVVPKVSQDNSATADTVKQTETQTTSKTNASIGNAGLDSTLAEFANNSVVDAKPGNTAVIEYSNDGNTVVTHYKHLNSISGNLYYSDINESGDTSLYLYFSEVNTALAVGSVNSSKTVRELMKRDDINISLSEFADRLITAAKNGGFVRDSNIAIIEKAYPKKAEELRAAKAEWRKKQEAEETAEREKEAKEFEEKTKETNKQAEAKLEEAANKLISQNATVKNETVTTYGENYNAKNTKLLLALLRKYDVKAPLATQGFIDNKVEDVVIKNGKIDTMHLKSKGHSDSAYAVLDELISVIKDVKADTKTDADTTVDETNENTVSKTEHQTGDGDTASLIGKHVYRMGQELVVEEINGDKVTLDNISAKQIGIDTKIFTTLNELLTRYKDENGNLLSAKQSEQSTNTVDTTEISTSEQETRSTTDNAETDGDVTVTDSESGRTSVDNSKAKKFVDLAESTTGKAYAFKHNGDDYVSDGNMCIRVTDAERAEMKKNFNGVTGIVKTWKGDIVSTLFEGNDIAWANKLPDKTYSLRTLIVVPFETPEFEETFIDARYIRYLDGPDNVWGFVKINDPQKALKGGERFALVSADESGNANGYVMPIRNVDISELKNEKPFESQSKLYSNDGNTTSTNTVKENKNNDESAVERKDRPDVRGLRPDVAEAAETEQGVQSETERHGGERSGAGKRLLGMADGTRDSGESIRNDQPDKAGDSDTGTDERNDSKGNDGGRNQSDDEHGGRQAESGDGRLGNDNEPLGVSGEVLEVNEEQTDEKKKTVKKKSDNFTYSPEEREYINKKRPNIQDNIAAIKTLQLVEREGRKATAEEKDILAKYKGWGGLSNAFSSYSTDQELRNLLSKEEYDEARRSTQNAHYTSLDVIEAMYKGLTRMGFNGGNLLEPSMGVGNFFGMLPKAVANKTNLYGVEMDSITGRIAKALYGDADITIAPYQDAMYADNSFDVAIGNVPFSSTTYNYKGEKHMLHDYFFVKTLDKVKDGGAVMFVTSTGTLDKANPKTRDAIAKKADLIAAFRLPGNAFKVNAGTEVTTDIIVLRKRPDGVPQSTETFFAISDIDGIPINEYFVRHPENILGKLVRKKDMYASERTQVEADERDYDSALTNAMSSLPKNILQTDMVASQVVVEDQSGKSRFMEMDGKLYFYDGNEKTKTELKSTDAERARQYMRLKDAYNGALNVSNNPNATDAERKAASEHLNKTYDDFVAKYKYLSSGTTKTALQNDSDYWMMTALEKKGEDSKVYEKADIFKSDLRANKPVEHVGDAHDALAVSLSNKGKVDIGCIQKLTGQSENEIADALADSIIKVPDGNYELTALYASGNIREKLEKAEKAAKTDPTFEKNVELLRASMPHQYTADEIVPKFGANWIDTSYYRNFIKETFGVTVALGYDKDKGEWIDEYVPKYAYNPKYGSADTLSRILIKTLMQKQVTVHNSDGTVDTKTTEQMRQYQQMLRDDFSAWIFGTEERRKALEKKFNGLYASWKGADFKEVGKHLNLEGKNPEIKLRDYQMGAVARVVFGGNTLLAHGVGTGKTFEMIASAMECKRLGITHKNLFVVPANKISDFKSDILKLYPNAKVMASKKGADAEERSAFISSLATTDFDIAVIGHPQFKFIPVSNETKRNSLNAQLAEIDATLANMSQDERRNNRRTVKQIEKTKESLEKKLKELETAKDATVDFESIGVDGLFVDEAHNFKKLPYYTKLKVAGVTSSNEAQRAYDMYEKTQYVQNIHGRVVFGTATPITNAVAEIYNMTRFVAPEVLTEAGIDSFDAWAGNFGNIENGIEIKPDGVNFRVKERFSKFVNVNAMTGMFRRFTDIIRSNEVLKDLPKAERVDVASESNEQLEKYLSDIQTRIEKLSSGGLNKDNMLLITSDGRGAALDLRLVAKQLKMSPDELDLSGSKVNRTVENVVKEYKNSASTKGAQLVFLDFGLSDDPTARLSFDIATDLVKKLTAQGIPANEIVRIDKVSDAKLEDFYKQVNDGKVRVVIGSTAKMGEGLNVQKRLVALHHMNPPFRPSDIEQREGRIIRYGNENKNVRIYRYLQKRSFDSYMWQMLERKQTMINQAMSDGNTAEIDDVDDFVLSAAEGKAITSGNPLLLKKMELDNKFKELSTAKSVFMRSIYSAKDVIANNPRKIETAKRIIDGGRKNASIINSHPFSGDFEIILQGKVITKRKTANEEIQKILNDGRYGMNKVHEIGSIRGMKLSFEQSGGKTTLYLDGALRLYVEAGADNIARLVNALESASKFETSNELKEYQDEVAGYEKQLAEAQKIVNSSFPKQKEYDETVAELNSVNKQMRDAAGGIDDELVYDADVNDDSANENGEAKQNVFQSKGESRWSVGANGNSDKIKSVTELKNDAERLFGVPINKGKLGVRTAGIYKTHAGTIRTRVDGDLPTIAHELGHHFDVKYSLSSFESVEGLENHYRDEIKALGYGEEAVAAEAIAHYFSDLAKDRNATEAEFPDFTDDLFNSLKGSDAKYLPQYIGEMNKYFAADRLRRREADVHYRAEEKSLKGQAQFQVDSFLANPRAYFGNITRTAVKYMFNDISTFKKFGRAHDYAMKERAANSVTYGRLTQTFTDNDGNVIGKSLKAILIDGNINTINRTAFDAYLQAQIALDRINAAEDSGDPSFKTQVYADADLQDKDNIVADIERYERENPTFHDCAQELYEYENNLLKIAEDAGLLGSELVSYLKSTFPHYVPLYRVMDDSNSVSAKSGRGAKTPSSVVGRFKGSGRGKWSPIENIMNQTASFTKAILQNQTREAVFSEIDNNDGMGIWAEKVPVGMVRDTVSTEEVKDIIKGFDFEHFADIKSTNEKLELIDAINRAIGGTTGMWKKADNQGKNVVSVMRNGETQYYEIHDKNLMDALLSLSPQSSSILSKTFRKATNAFANLTTGSNPRFGYNNLIRDMQTGFINSQTTNNPFRFTVDLIKSFNEIVRDTDDYKRFRANGGGYSGAFTMNIGNLKKLSKEIIQEPNKGKRLVQEMFGFIPRALDGVETSNRFAEYQRNIKMGSDALTALRASQNITVNFQQGGKFAKEVNAFIPYFNASIQSVYQMCEHITDKKTRKRTLAKIFATSIANAALAIGLRELIKRLLPDDDKADEAYENLSAYNKFANWNIYIGDGEFVRIPKEKNLMIFSTLLEATFEKVVNDDKEAYDGIAQYFAESVMPPFINDVTLFGTLMELKANETYTGAPIIPSAYQDLAPELQYDGDTSSVSIALGSALGVSPMVIDYIIDDNTGFIGDLYINLTKSEGTSLSEMLDTVKTSEKSLLKGMSVPSVLLRDATYSTDIVSNFYDTKEEYTQNSKSYKATNGQNSKYTFYDTYGKYKYDKVADLYSNVNSLIKADNDSDTSRETRWMLNSIIKSINETESTQLDKDVAELSERTGYSFQEIAPFIVVPESLKDSEKNEYYLDAYDLMNYYTESQLLFEYWYPQVISSGYDDESMAEALKQMKKEIKSEMDARYLEILSH